MKKLLFIFVLFAFGMSANAQTNVYHPFPDSAFWRVDYYYDQPFYPSCFARYYFQYYTAGDTMINSKSHKKIYRSYVIFDSISCTPPVVPPGSPGSGYVGALRDDSIDNKTFFVFPNTTTDTLLYDYNLNIGDTLKGYISQYTTNYEMVVISIDSILIKGQYRKRWNFTEFNYDTIYVIEGIGTSSGLIEPGYSESVDFTWRCLICVKDSSGLLFSSGYNSTIGCDLITEGINEINIKKDIIDVYPNPATDNLTIETGDLRSTNYDLKINDIVGNTILEKTLYNKVSTIDISSLAKGMYFVKVKTEKTVESKKFIKL